MEDSEKVLVYREEFPDSGSIYFGFRDLLRQGGVMTWSIKGLASLARNDLSFKGHDDIEKARSCVVFLNERKRETPKGLSSRTLCPLTAEEQAEFWSHFNSDSD